MAIQIFDEFLKEFEQPITAFVSNSVQNLAAAIDTPLRTAVTLWVVLYGIAILRGTIRESIMSFAWSAARVIVIVALATNASTFQTYVTGLFFESLPKEIGNAIAGAGLDTSSGVPFDKLLNKGIEVATKIYEQSGLTNIAPALIAAILMVFTAVSGFLQFAVLLYAKIGLGIVIALGPLFIAFMLFEVTRPFGVAWTRQVANFIILHVLVVRSGRPHADHREQLRRQVWRQRHEWRPAHRRGGRDQRHPRARGLPCPAAARNRIRSRRRGRNALGAHGGIRRSSLCRLRREGLGGRSPWQHRRGRGRAPRDQPRCSGLYTVSGLTDSQAC